MSNIDQKIRKEATSVLLRIMLTTGLTLCEHKLEK